MKILIVEDDTAQKRLWEQSIELRKEKVAVNIDCIYKDNLPEAQEYLKITDVDWIIVDLRLTSTNPDNLEWEELIPFIKSNKTSPLIVYSGNLWDLSEDIKKTNSEFLKFYAKGWGTWMTDILNEIYKYYESGIINIFRKQWLLNTNIVSIFRDHLAHNKDYLEYIITTPNTEKIVSRYIAIHMVEYLDIEYNWKDRLSDKYDHTEFYICPTIRSYVFTGQILYGDKRQLYTVLTPACDCERWNTNHLLLPISDRKDFKVNKKKISNIVSDASKSAEAERFIRSWFDHKHYYFLPPCNLFDFQGWILNFDNYIELARDDVDHQKYKCIASVSSPFLKNIISKFVLYLIEINDIEGVKRFARQWQPDFHYWPIIHKLNNGLA